MDRLVQVTLVQIVLLIVFFPLAYTACLLFSLLSYLRLFWFSSLLYHVDRGPLNTRLIPRWHVRNYSILTDERIII